MSDGALSHRVRSSVEPIRFYFDESALGLGQAVAGARGDAVFPGHPRCLVQPGTADAAWVPAVAEAGWIVLMRDKRIDRRPAEIAALAASSTRAVVLNRAGQLKVWDQLRLVARWWDAIEDLADQDAPWLATLNSRGVRVRQYPA